MDELICHFEYKDKKHSERNRRCTIVSVYDEDMGAVKYGLSVCANIDNFSRKAGRTEASKRANYNPFTFEQIYNSFQPNKPGPTKYDMLFRLYRMKGYVMKNFRKMVDEQESKIGRR